MEWGFTTDDSWMEGSRWVWKQFGSISLMVDVDICQ